MGYCKAYIVRMCNKRDLVNIEQRRRRRRKWG